MEDVPKEKEFNNLKKTPRYQAQKWLSGVCKLVTECADKQPKAKRATKSPANTNKVDEGKSTRHEEELETLEKEIRANINSVSLLRKALGPATEEVEAVTADVAAFNLLWRGYYKDND